MKILIEQTVRENTEMADIGEEFKTRNVYKEVVRKTKVKQRNYFKRNVPKRLRKEWGERMSHLSSIR